MTQSAEIGLSIIIVGTKNHRSRMKIVQALKHFICDEIIIMIPTQLKNSQTNPTAEYATSQPLKLIHSSTGPTFDQMKAAASMASGKHLWFIPAGFSLRHSTYLYTNLAIYKSPKKIHFFPLLPLPTTRSLRSFVADCAQRIANTLAQIFSYPGIEQGIIIEKKLFYSLIIGKNNGAAENWSLFLARAKKRNIGFSSLSTTAWTTYPPQKRFTAMTGLLWHIPQLPLNYLQVLWQNFRDLNWNNRSGRARPDPVENH